MSSELIQANEAVEKVIRNFLVKTSNVIPALAEHFDQVNDSNYILMAQTILLFFPTDDEKTVRNGIKTITALRKSSIEITDEQFSTLYPIICKHLNVLKKCLQ